MFPEGFPSAICQALAIPLAWYEMLRGDSMRYTFTLVAVGGELLEIVQMNLCQESLHAMGGKLVATLIIRVEPEDFDFDSNLHDNWHTSTLKPLAMLSHFL